MLAGAGYLISQFLSPVVNRRKDEYGGDLQNRMRFALEVIQEVRQAVGPEYPVIVRLAGNEFMEGGLENKEARVFARELEKTGVDMLSVIGGWHESRVPQISMALPAAVLSTWPKGSSRPFPFRSWPATGSTIQCLRNRFLRDGRADLIGFARSLIADPELPNKARTGRLDEIRLLHRL